VITIISNQCIHSVRGDGHTKWRIELSNGAHSICRTRGSINSSQGRHRGCGDDDVTDQVITEISNQCIHSVWRDADSLRIIELRIGSDSICRTRGSCHSSQGRHRGCGDDDVTDKVITTISNQCIHSVWGDADSLRIIELRIGSDSICRTR
jgi:hypothetical protein